MDTNTPYILSCETPLHVENVVIPPVDGEEDMLHCRGCGNPLTQRNLNHGTRRCDKCRRQGIGVSKSVKHP